MTPAEIIAAYEKLLETALGVVQMRDKSGLPHVNEVSRSLRLGEELRTLKWYDDGTVYWSEWRLFEGAPTENTTYVMPDYLLMMTPEELAQWRDQERSAAEARYIKMQEDRAARISAEAEQAERQLLATLKQKYEGNA